MTRKEIIESTKVQGGMYAVIPSVVMLDDQLSVSARMLYGVIVWACNQNACTWASNRALGAYMGLSPKRISELIAQLEKQGHIETEVVRDTRTNQVERRYIYPVVKSSKGMLPREDTPIPKNQDTSPETSVYPPPKNQEVKEPNINNKNIPPYNPPKGDDKRRRRKRRPKAVPEWQPERFEGFWNAYPRDEDRAKAVEQWDLIPQDQKLMEQYASEDELLHEMSVGLKRHLDCEDWREGRGIPYAFRWLRDRKWTEKKKTVQSQKADRPPGPGDNAPARVVEEEGTYLL